MRGDVILRPLSEQEILRWADAHHELTGRWPTRESGPIPGTIGETWAGIHRALRWGRRGLPGGSSLAQFLVERRGAWSPQYRPPLSIEQILCWADEYRGEKGDWPTRQSGTVRGSAGETWAAVEAALAAGTRGLPGGSSLRLLLAEHRGVRHLRQLPPFTEEQILGWADAHHARTGSWPTGKSGPVVEAPGETWTAIQVALRQGRRGLPGGSSLALLLADRRGARNVWSLPLHSVALILTWADAHRQRTGRWPTRSSGSIPDAPGETWQAVDHALHKGLRGLPGGSSLADLLHQERGTRQLARLPRLRVRSILAWADAHRRRTGAWPTRLSGPIPEAAGEVWANVDQALRLGLRGLSGGSSLPRFLAQHRGRRHKHESQRLSRKKILQWADAHFQRTGRWPHRGTGPVLEAPGETWDTIDNALRNGLRGLPGGSGLTRLLAAKRGARHRLAAPPLTEAQILSWADRHFQQTGTWPRHTSGPIAGAPGETWAMVQNALYRGQRGLAGNSSLYRLLAEHRGVRSRVRKPEPGDAPSP
jgi:hypothetical protein